DSLRIELWVDRAIKRVGEIYTFAVAADLHHLRPAVEVAVRCRMRGTRDNPADPDLSYELRCEGVGTERSMSVTRGGTALKPFKSGGSRSGSAGSAGISMIFFTAHL